MGSLCMWEMILKPLYVLLSAEGLSLTYAVRLLQALVEYMDKTSNCEFALLWCQAVLSCHGRNLRSGIFECRDVCEYLF